MGPTNPHCDQVHAEKYRRPGETFEAAMIRVATGLADFKLHRDKLVDILTDMRFMPAGRVQAAIGGGRQITPYNCFVAGTLHDSFVHGDEFGENSIMDIARQAATTMRMGGGIGYDWSTLRPRKDFINGVQSTTDGPLAFMPIYDAICKATSSAGNRRGAQMGVLRVDHPDIRAFIRAKQPSGALADLWAHVEELPGDHPNRMQLVLGLQETLRLTGFNISVAITDHFMNCLAAQVPFQLQFEGRVYGEVDPVELWEEIMRSTWDWAEPGVLFIDRINQMNNLWYCETIAATNPCGEQPLPPHGACLLGSFNLARYVSHTDGVHTFNWEQFKADIFPVVRAMDNVVNYAQYPLLQQKHEAYSKRRMGLGVTGLANAAEALGYPYGTTEFLEFEAQVLTTLRDLSYNASVRLAEEKGSFPLYRQDHYLAGRFIRSLPDEIQDDIRRYGIRNSHLTSIAPTGTISYCADNVSSSIEPVFMYAGQRKMKTIGGDVIVDVNDYGVQKFGTYGRLASEISAEEHVLVLAKAASLVDSSVSKTCNVSPTMDWAAFKRLYVAAYELGAKGCTTFNPGGKRLGIFTPKLVRDEPAVCTFDPETGRRNCE